MIQKFLVTKRKKIAMDAAGGAARGGDTDMLVNEPAVDVAPPADVSAATDGVFPMPIAAGAYSSALVDGQRFQHRGRDLDKALAGGIARAVQEATAPTEGVMNREGVSPGRLVVPCKNFSIYGKRMRDVHMAGFSMKSDLVVRFRSSDGKVAVADLLVGVGRYSYVHLAQKAIYKMMEDSDGKLSYLNSLEINMQLFDQKVCILNICTEIP